MNDELQGTSSIGYHAHLYNLFDVIHVNFNITIPSPVRTQVHRDFVRIVYDIYTRVRGRTDRLAKLRAEENRSYSSNNIIDIEMKGSSEYRKVVLACCCSVFWPGLGSNDCS